MGYLGVPPQDVLPPSSSSAWKLRHLQHFPQDIPLPILCWTGSVTGIGFYLVCCCRGVRFSLFGGSFAFLGDVVVERHDGGEKARCIDGINTTIYYYENSHNHMI